MKNVNSCNITRINDRNNVSEYICCVGEKA